MYKKVYLEITNICNLDCFFCHKTKRQKKLLSVEEFTYLSEKIRPFTDYLYLHLMGEPLLHPLLGDFLGIAENLGFKTTIVSNGFLVDKRAEELLSHPPYKVTFSLHSYEANETDISLKKYLSDIIDFCKKAEEKGTICVLRLWNGKGENRLNDEIISELKKDFSFTENRKGFTLSKRIYLEFADMFVWPDNEAPRQDVRFCMGLRDHLGVLSDGTVVPCCLDADGSIPLGNLFTEKLTDIVNSPRAKAIYEGFSQKRCAEEMCKHCQYATRFN